MRRNSFLQYGIPWFRMAVTVGTFLVAGGCSMPNSMEVRSGTDPRHSDDNVRFRTTLYLRVFQICINSSDPDDFRPVLDRSDEDSLYRFRMTGKANALGNEVRFESGILRSHEIDGFGTPVRVFKRDEKEGTKDTRDRNSGKLPGADGEVGKPAAAGDGTASSGQGVARHPTKNNPEITRDKDKCTDGYELRQKFAMRGPEGWRVLDPEERLILAMSSSAKPLVSSLRTLAALRDDSQATSGQVLRDEEIRVLEFLIKLKNEAAMPASKAVGEAIELLGGPKSESNGEGEKKKAETPPQPRPSPEGAASGETGQ